MRLYDFLFKNTKTAEYRATERPRSSRSVLPVANLIFYHHWASLHDFTTRHNNEFKDLGTESNKICDSHIKSKKFCDLLTKIIKIQDFAGGDGTMAGSHFGDFGMPKSPKWRLWHGQIAISATLACPSRHAQVAISATLACPSRHFGDFGMPNSQFR